MANGIYSNSELVESILADLNSLLKHQNIGEHVTACVIVAGMAQKLTTLIGTIDNDIKSRDETIESLKAALRRGGQEVVEVSPEGEE